jgi:hypothetical protein
VFAHRVRYQQRANDLTPPLQRSSVEREVDRIIMLHIR